MERKGEAADPSHGAHPPRPAWHGEGSEGKAVDPNPSAPLWLRYLHGCPPTAVRCHAASLPRRHLRTSVCSRLLRSLGCRSKVALLRAWLHPLHLHGYSPAALPLPLLHPVDSSNTHPPPILCLPAPPPMQSCVTADVAGRTDCANTPDETLVLVLGVTNLGRFESCHCRVSDVRTVQLLM